MKILLDHGLPLSLAPGGFAIQIENTMDALRRAGSEVEPLRWWDRAQSGDLIHFFGRPSDIYVRLAAGRGVPVVMNDLLSGLENRPAPLRAGQVAVMRALQALTPRGAAGRLGWRAYRECAACVALTQSQADLMVAAFGVPRSRVFVVPNGVDPVFFAAAASPGSGRAGKLVCAASINRRKRVLELARAAVAAGVPVRFLGAPLSETDAYYREFAAFAARHPEFVEWSGPVRGKEAMAAAFAHARGFVLLSSSETLSLAALEAAATGCPLLLADLPWARNTFGGEAHYCPVAGERRTAMALKAFWAVAERERCRYRPWGWDEVGTALAEIHRGVLCGWPQRARSS